MGRSRTFTSTDFPPSQVPHCQQPMGQHMAGALPSLCLSADPPGSSHPSLSFQLPSVLSIIIIIIIIRAAADGPFGSFSVNMDLQAVLSV